MTLLIPEKTYHVRSVNVAKCKLLTIHRGVCCCVSYTSTASWVATAYTIRYGKANAGCGPKVSEPLSVSAGLGEDIGLTGSVIEVKMVLECGGGSMNELVVGVLELTIGSGKDGIASSAEEVSKVMWLVAFEDCRCV